MAELTSFLQIRTRWIVALNIETRWAHPISLEIASVDEYFDIAALVRCFLPVQPGDSYV